jgi:uncharacterized membrane protein HdeD (DUF308 family)
VGASVIGLFMLEDPVRAEAVLTLLIPAGLFVGDLLRVVFALVECFPAWPLGVLPGAVDLVFGAPIFRGWPESSLWVIGLFLGIDPLFHGWSSVVLALTVPTSGAALPDSPEL